MSPDPCFNDNCGSGDGGGGNGNGPDGGDVLNDEWGPIASLLITPPSTQTWLVTWYSTRADPANLFTAIYGSETGSALANPFTSVQPIASGAGVPWDHTRADWWDYQAVGFDNVSKTFLDAWGGDARSGGPFSVWTARITP